MFLSAKEYIQTNKIKYSIHLINSIIEIIEINLEEKINDNIIAAKYERKA
ncbi:hypothetical protein SHINM13_10620 [Flavobacterium ammonificans]|nr:hypothetical protein SHINM13_10620 [Flavobacterium ammonificans]